MTDRDYDTKAYEDGVRAGRQEMQAEIERLRGSIVLQEELIRHGEREIARLRAEVKTWVGHAKTAIWSDSEECKLLEAENERLRAALERIAKRGNSNGYVMSIEHAVEIARAAIAVALEEAAKVAEYRIGAAEWSAETNSGYECASKEIAAAIRALKEEK